MGAVTKPPFAIVFLMIITLGLPLCFSAGDLPETAYDESETLPYESTPTVSIVAQTVAARTTQRPLSSSHLKPGAPSLFAPARVLDTDANRSAVARASLTLLCTLRC